MADTVKTAGLKLTIDGQAEFMQNVKVINQELKLSYQEFRLVNEQQRLQGTSTESLAQKASILSNEYDLQLKKIKELKQGIKENTEEFGENSEEVKKLEVAHKRAEVGVERLKRQIFYNTVELEKSKSTVYQTGIKFDEFGQKAQSVGNKLKGIGNTMTVAVTAPIMAGAAYAVKSASDMEAAMIDVQKTTDMAGDELKEMEMQFRELSKEIPSTAVEIANVAEVAGQLGIEKSSIVDFTKVVIDMGNATNIAGEEGASSMAKFANITQMSQKDFDRFGSSIVELGNNMATTEQDVLNMAMRLASAGSQAGLSEADILGVSAALSSLGLEAQAGGTAFSKMITRLQLAVETGSEDLDMLAAVAGMTGEQFKRSFEEDAAGALVQFITGLGDTERHGQSTAQILETLEIKEIRLSDALRRTAGSGDLLSDAIEMGNTAWRDNTALVEEAALKYSSAESQIQINRNKLQDTAITIGQQLLPHVVRLAENIGNLVQKFNDLNPQTQDLIIKMLGIAAAAGPIMRVGGTIIGGVGKLTSGIGDLLKKLGERAAVTAATEAIEGMGGAVGAATAQAAGMTTGLGMLGSVITGPVGITIGVAGLVAAIAALITHSQSASAKAKEMREDFDEIGVTFQKSKDDALANAGAAEHLADKLFALAETENKTNAQKMQMAQMVQQLNELIPDLGLEYDSLNDTLNMTESDIAAVTETMKQQMIVTALEEAVGEYAKTMAKAGIEQDNIKNKLDPVKVAYEDFTTKLNTAKESQKWMSKEVQGMSFENQLKEFPGLHEAYEKLGEVTDDVGVKLTNTYGYTASELEVWISKQEKLLDEQKDLYDDAANEFDTHSEKIGSIYEEITEASDGATEGQINNLEDLEQAELDALEAKEEFAERMVELEEYMSESYNESYGEIESRARDHYQSMGTIEDEGIEKSEITAVQVQANLEKQIADFQDWHGNIQGIAGRVPEDVLYELQQLGPKYAPLMAELNNMTDTELNNFVDTWQRKSEVSVDVAAGEFERLPGEMIKPVDGIATAMDGNKNVERATVQMTERMLKVWEESGRNTKIIGQKIPAQAAQGILSKQQDIITAGETMGDKGVEGFRNTHGRIEISGTQWADGAIRGILANEYRLEVAGRRMGDAVNRGFDSVAEIKSPSRRAERSAGQIVAGYLNRFKTAEKELFEAGSDLADAYQKGFDQYRGAGRLRVNAGGISGGGSTVNEYHVTNYIDTPVALTEREAARQMKNSLKELAYVH